MNLLRGFAVAVLAGVVLAGCGPYHRYLTEKACEDAVRLMMRSPASTKFVQSELTMHDRSFEWILTYDSANAFNAPIRGKARCWAIEFDGKGLVVKVENLE